MKVLVVRFSSIGDIILTTPVVRCLSKQLDVEIHYLTKSGFRMLLESNPYINRIYSIEKGPGEVLAQLKSEQYDLVVDLHHNLRTFLLKQKLGRPASSFHKINLEKWMKVNLHVDLLPKLHIVDRYMETVVRLGVQNDGAGLDYFIPEDDVRWAVQYFERLGILEHICISVGAAHQTKCLTTGQLTRLCQRMDVPVFLLGGKGELEKAAMICKHSGPHVYNLCGELTLHQSAACIDRAGLVISHDTGVMHMAAALKKPLISVWGNTIPAFGMTPYFGNIKAWERRFEVSGLSCRPCSKIGYESCPKGHFRCIKDMPVDEIAETANRKLST